MYRYRKVFYWLVIGIFLSLALSSMMMTRDGSLHQFYDDGYTADLEEKWREAAYYLGQYDVGQKTYTWNSEQPACCIPVNTWEKKIDIHYLLIEGEYVSGKNAVWRVSYRDLEGNEQEATEFPFSDGNMAIPIRRMEDGLILVQLICSENTGYKINEMLLSEYENLTEKGIVLYGSVLIFLIYSIVCLILFKWKKIKIRTGDRILFALQHQADGILQYLSYAKSQEKYAPWIRRLLFVGINVGWRLLWKYGAHRYYGYGILLHTVFLLTLIAWIPLEKDGTERSNAISKAWLWLCIIQIISDIMIRKYYGFVGLWSLLLFGLLFRAWSRMEEPKQLLEDFVCSAEMLYLGEIIYCIFSDNIFTGFGMLDGTWTNQNTFSIVITFYMTIMAFRLCQALENKGKWYRYLEGVGGVLIGIWMLKGAECRTAWLTFAVITAVLMIWILKFLGNKWNIHKKWKVWGIAGAILLLLGGAIFCYQNGMILSHRQIANISLNSISSNRISIWERYLGQINLYGHINRLENYIGTGVYAHNNLLKLMYRYGFIAGILAIVLFVEMVFVIVKLWKKNAGNARTFLVAGIVIAYIIPAFLESISEYPMVVINWFGFYLIAGYLMQEKNAGMVNDG